MGQPQNDKKASAIIAECLRRADAGQPVDPQRVLAKYPECAAELREYFAGEQMLGNALEKRPKPGETTPQTVFQRETVAPEASDSVPAGTGMFDHLPVEFGRYRVLKVLGQGAMGAVYLAHDTKLGRDVALKTPKIDDSTDHDLVGRFEREARSAAILHHRNICPVYDVGEINGVHYLTMAFIDGKPLSSVVSEDRPLPGKQAALVVRKLALGLQEAHVNGVIHRDLKPANVMVDGSREPVVMDFGLARQLENADQSRLTNVGTVMGSPAYMSPEQVSGELNAVGPSADIYSLGVILFELLSGRLPYEGSMVAILGQIVGAEPPDVRERRSDVDPELAEICNGMIAKSPVDRYGTMQDVADVLSSWLKKQHRKTIQPARKQAAPAAYASMVFDELPTPDQSLPLPRKKTKRRPQSTKAKTSDRTKLIAGGTTAAAGLLLLAVVIIRFPSDSNQPDQEVTDVAVDGERLSQPTPEPLSDEGFESIFNGDNFYGWRLEGSSGWSIADGQLVGEGANSRLVTNSSDYGDCEVRVECQLPAGANSGVFLHTTNGDPSSGYEAQISNQPFESTMTGGISGHSHVKEHLIDDDEWFELRFRAEGNQLTVFVNGKQTSTVPVPAGAPQTGAIALQSWDNLPVRFRTIEVRRLTKPTHAAASREGFVDLFNGRDLAGWHEQFTTLAWSVRNGEIVSRERDGTESLGWLATNDSFMNFDFEFEYFLRRKGNSGVFLRAIPGTHRNGADQLEIQLIDDSAPNKRPASPMQLHGAIYNTAAVKPRAVDAPPRRWNQMAIRAVGDQITVSVNGTEVCDANLDQLQSRINGRFQYRKPGPIGLQWYGTSVKFRNLRIRVLDAEGKVVPSDRGIRNSSNVFGE